MIDRQHSIASRRAAATPLELSSGQVLRLGDGGGDIAVIAGRVWLTSSGDPSDHVLGAGEVLKVGGGGTLVEPWHRHASAVIAWQPKSFGERLRERLTRA